MSNASRQVRLGLGTVGILVVNCCVGIAGLRADEPVVPGARLRVWPAAAPGSATTPHLLPPAADIRPGNAALSYYRAIVMQLERGGALEAARSEITELVPNPMPTNVPADRLAPLLAQFESVFRELDRGARRRDCEFQLPVDEDAFQTLLPEAQEMRSLMRLLVLRAQVAAVEGRPDEALRHLQTGFGLARHLGSTRPGTLILLLVGLALQKQAQIGVETLLAQPQAPNLYWALTELPQPFIDPRAAWEAEQLGLEWQFPGLVDCRRDSPLSLDEARRLLDDVLALLPDLRDRATAAQEVGDVLRLARQYVQGRRDLAARGVSTETIDRMPAQQVALGVALRKFDDELAAHTRWLTLPWPQALAGLRADEAREAGAAGDDLGHPFVRYLLPSGYAIAKALSRSDRDAALLRAVEALRMHAAQTGQWPDTLDEVSAVPVPENPQTGLPFEYRREGDLAVLAAPPDVEGFPDTGRRYELELAR